LNWSASPAGNATFGNANLVSTTVTLTGNCTVTATFTELFELTLTAFPGDGGTVAPLGITIIPNGTACTIEATPRTNYAFVHWTAQPSANAVFGQAGSQQTTVTLSGNCVVTASFAYAPLLGDFSCDGMLNSLDIPYFKEALVNKELWESQSGRDADRVGDFNGDGAFNSLDIVGFKQALAQ